MPIPAGEYTATVYVRTTDDARDNTMENEAKIGEIVRNGATANVSYLTTSEKHNQRLIIVNRGSRPITMTGITFQTEDGTEADLVDGAAASMSFNGPPSNVSVATTQVNLEDSSTDTVIWPVQ